ncbi:hypothetical protein MKX01_001301 [Papaver californicum]|nr:hypothetical protein MKX01_001301 [Papaver californicum]
MELVWTTRRATCMQLSMDGNTRKKSQWFILNPSWMCIAFYSEKEAVLEPTSAILFFGVCMVLGIGSRNLSRGTKVPYTIALLFIGVGLGLLGGCHSPYVLHLQLKWVNQNLGRGIMPVRNKKLNDEGCIIEGG